MAKRGNPDDKFFLFDTCAWRGETFQKIGDVAKIVFIFLVTGPKTTRIPGIALGAPDDIARALDLPESEVLAALDELRADGCAIYENGMFWLPNATKFEHIVNPYIVRSWRKIWPFVPHGDLKRCAWLALRDWSKAKGPVYAKEFSAACVLKDMPVKEARAPKSGWVYFIHDPATSRIKIGFSANVEKRLRTLQTGSSSTLAILGKTRGTDADERAFHQRFAAHRVGGEWFHASPELVSFIAEVSK
jgi:hypothetical protein